MSVASVWAVVPDGRRVEQRAGLADDGAIQVNNIIRQEKRGGAMPLPAAVLRTTGKSEMNAVTGRRATVQRSVARAENPTGVYEVGSLPYSEEFAITEWTTNDIWTIQECIKFNVDADKIKSYAMEYRYGGYSFSSFGFDCMPDTAHQILVRSNDGGISCYFLLGCNPYAESDKIGAELMLLHDPDFDYSDFKISMTEAQTPRRMTCTEYLDEVRESGALNQVSVTTPLSLPWNVTPEQPVVSSFEDFPFVLDHTGIAVTMHAHRINVPSIPAGRAYTLSASIDWENSQSNPVGWGDTDYLSYRLLQYKNGEYVMPDAITEGGEYMILNAATVSLGTVGRYTMQYTFTEADYATLNEIFDPLEAHNMNNVIALNDQTRKEGIIEGYSGVWQYSAYKVDLKDADEDVLLYLTNIVSNVAEDGNVYVQVFRKSAADGKYEFASGNSFSNQKAVSMPLIEGETAVTDEAYILLLTRDAEATAETRLRIEDITPPDPAQSKSIEEIIAATEKVTLPHSAWHTIDQAVATVDGMATWVRVVRFDMSSAGMLKLEATEATDPVFDDGTLLYQRCELYREVENGEDVLVYGWSTPYGGGIELDVRQGSYYVVFYDMEYYGINSVRVSLSAKLEPPTEGALAWNDVMDKAEAVTLPYVSTNRVLSNMVHINDNGQKYYVDAVKFTLDEEAYVNIEWASQQAAFMFLNQLLSGYETTQVISNVYNNHEGVQKLAAGTYYMFAFDESFDKSNYTKLLKINVLRTTEEVFQELKGKGEYETMPGVWTPNESEMEKILTSSEQGYWKTAKPMVFNVEEEMRVRIELDGSGYCPWYEIKEDGTLTDMYISSGGEVTLTPGVYGALMAEGTTSMSVEVLSVGKACNLSVYNDNRYGTVSMTGDKPQNVDGTWKEGTTVTVTVTPKAGYAFDSWKDIYWSDYETVDNTNPRTVTLTKEYTEMYPAYTKEGYDALYANEFDAKRRTITVDYNKTGCKIDEIKLTSAETDGPIDLLKFTLDAETPVSITFNTTDPDMILRLDGEEIAAGTTARKVLYAGEYEIDVWGGEDSFGKSYDLSIVKGEFNEVGNIREFVNAAVTDREITITGEVAVTYSSGQYHYIQDETGKLLIFGTLSQTLKNGDRITGLKGKYALHNNAAQMTNATITTVTAGETVKPTETDYYEYVWGEEVHSYVILRKCSVKELLADAKDKDMIVSMDGSESNEVTVYNKFGIDIDGLQLAIGDEVDVVGMIALYNGNRQLYPVSVEKTKDYKVNVTLGNGGEFYKNGWIETAGTYTYPYEFGSQFNLWVHANDGYWIDNITVNGVAVDEKEYSNNGMNLDVYITVSEDLDIVITFRDYKIATFTAGEGGTINPTGEVRVPQETQYMDVTVKANDGYEIDKLFVDGQEQIYTSAPGSKDYLHSLNVGSSKTTMEVTFRPEVSEEYVTITFNAGEGGYFSPNATMKRKKGDPFEVYVGANNGYEISNITVCGEPYTDEYYVGRTGYTIYVSVEEDCEIKATFSGKTYSVTTTAGKGGTVSADATEKEYGGTFTFDITADEGYVIDKVTVDGSSEGYEHLSGRKEANDVVSKEVTQNAQVIVTFRNYYRVWLTSSTGGSTTPSREVQVMVGEQLTFTAIANQDYVISYMDDRISGEETGEGEGETEHIYTVTPTGDGVIHVQFVTSIQLTITVTAGEGGTVSPSGEMKLYEGGMKTLEITANTGYVIDAIHCNGKVMEDIHGWGGQETFALTITATAENDGDEYLITFREKSTAADYATVKFSAGVGGTISPEGDVQKKKGEVFTFTVNAADGYIIESVTIGGVPYASDTYVGQKEYTFNTSVEADCEIMATFRSDAIRVYVTHGEGGYTDVDGYMEGRYGDNMWINIHAYEGYVVNTIKKDGVNITTNDQRGKTEVRLELKRVTAAETRIHVEFAEKGVENYYTLTVEVNDETMGRVTKTGGETDGNGNYKEGSEVTLKAVAENGHEFVEWEDGSKAATRTVTVTEDMTVKATFRKSEATGEKVTVTITAGEGGTVSPEGEQQVAEGGEIDIEITADEGWVIRSVKVNGKSQSTSLKGKTSGTYTHTDAAEGDEIAVAFEEEVVETYYRVTAKSDNEQMGIVTISGGTKNDDGDYLEGSEITVVATPKKGYKFVRWSNDETEAIIEMTVEKDVTLTAYFAEEVGTDVENAEAMTMTVYSDDLVLNVVSEDKVSLLVVTDASGRTVYAGYERTTTVPQSGIYMVRLGNETAKVVVTRGR